MLQLFILFELTYLGMFGDDHVTCYMGVDGDASERVDT